LHILFPLLAGTLEQCLYICWQTIEKPVPPPWNNFIYLNVISCWHTTHVGVPPPLEQIEIVNIYSTHTVHLRSLILISPISSLKVSGGGHTERLGYRLCVGMDALKLSLYAVVEVLRYSSVTARQMYK
jgi:hypothetical protein